MGTLEALEGSMCFLAEAEGWRPQVEQGAGKSHGPLGSSGQDFGSQQHPWPLRAEGQAAHPKETRWHRLTEGSMAQISADGKQWLEI